jgi:AcrR family transcriptional regulator
VAPARQSLPSQTGLPPVSARGNRTREALVVAARRVFERDGYLDARITDISAAAGVATGSFYTYFTGKQDAFSAVMEQVNEEMLHPRLGDPVDPVQSIEAANRAYLAAYRRNAKLMGLMEQVAQIDEEFRALRLKRARAFVQRNARAIARLQSEGVADPELDPRLAAHAMSSMVSRMAYLKYVQGFGSASDEELVQTLTRLWANALGIGRSKRRWTSS